MSEKSIRGILDKLVQDPELKKYPHSYNPIIIDHALSAIRQMIMGCVPEKRMVTPEGQTIPYKQPYEDIENRGFNDAIDTMKANVERAFK